MEHKHKLLNFLEDKDPLTCIECGKELSVPTIKTVEGSIKSFSNLHER